MQGKEPCEEQPTEQLAEHADRQDKGGSRRYPALPVTRYPAARYDHMDVRMVGHCRAPCVEHGGDADPGAEMLRIGGNGEHCLRRRPEQQVVERRLVLEGDIRDLAGQREDDVEVADRQQVRLALGEPRARRCALALRAVSVAAAVVGDPLMPAGLAGLDMTAKRGGAAGLDRRHHLELEEAQMPGMGGPVCGPGGAEDVGDLERGPHRINRRASCLP